MEKYLRWIVSCGALTLSACSPVNSLKPFDQQQAALVLQQNYNPQPAKERIKLALPKNKPWQRIDLSLGTLGTPIMLVPPGQTDHHWNESFISEIRPYLFHPNITAEKYMRERIESVKNDCSQVNIQTSEYTKQTATFTLQLLGCHYLPDQTQVTKAFTGIDAVYVVRYAALTNTVKPSTMITMTQVIKTATLVRDQRLMTAPPLPLKNGLSFLFDHD